MIETIYQTDLLNTDQKQRNIGAFWCFFCQIKELHYDGMCRTITEKVSVAKVMNPYGFPNFGQIGYEHKCCYQMQELKIFLAHYTYVSNSLMTHFFIEFHLRLN